MARLSDVYGITGPKAEKTKGSVDKVSIKMPKAQKTRAAPPSPKIDVARSAVAAMPSGEVRFLMKISQEMSDRLEAERQRRGLRSRTATILAVLDEGLVK